MLKFYLFSEIPLHQIKVINDNSQTYKIVNQEIVFEEGQPCTGIYIIQEG